MSKRDRLHSSVVKALEKEGWKITDDPLILVLEQTLLKADLGAEKTLAAEKAGQKIAVEIKEFSTSSAIPQLEKTIGQLQLYQWALEDQEPERKLFLAVAQRDYTKYFQKPIFKLVLKRNKINLLVFESIKEEIVQWILP